MPTGPNGEKRPKCNIQAAIITAKIAVGELTEEDARKLVEVPKS